MKLFQMQANNSMQPLQQKWLRPRLNIAKSKRIRLLYVFFLLKEDVKTLNNYTMSGFHHKPPNFAQLGLLPEGAQEFAAERPGTSPGPCKQPQYLLRPSFASERD